MPVSYPVLSNRQNKDQMILFYIQLSNLRYKISVILRIKKQWTFCMNLMLSVKPELTQRGIIVMIAVNPIHSKGKRGVYRYTAGITELGVTARKTQSRLKLLEYSAKIIYLYFRSTVR